MKKLILIAVLAVGFNAKSQEYYHGAGVGFMMGFFNQEYTTPYSDVSENMAAFVPGVTYKATLAFEMNRSSSLGITAAPFLGFFLSSAGGSYLGYQLPIMAEYVLGDLDDRCFYFGGGFNYGFIADGFTGGTVVGPILGLGGQFEFRDQLIGLRGGYTIGVNKEKNVPAGTVYQRDSRSALTLTAYYVF